MSKYSGKCDFGDLCEIYGEEKTVKAKVYIGNNIMPLAINSYKDALPYFPFLVGLSVCNEDGMTMRLSRESYVDSYEREVLSSYLDTVIRYYKRCKRKKETFDANDALKHISWFDENETYKQLIVNEVENNGVKSEIPQGCHMPIAEIYREMLFNDMVYAGYTPSESARWCFGIDRTFNGDLPLDVSEAIMNESQNRSENV